MDPDLIIVGGGIAGSTAALCAAHYGMPPSGCAAPASTTSAPAATGS